MDTKPIRVLQVIGQMNRGGAEAMIMNLYRHIDRKKVQFDFLVHTEEEGLYDEEIRKLGGNIYSVSKFKGYNALSYMRQCRKFYQNHPELDLVHGHIGSSAALYLGMAKKEGRYTVAHSHSAEVHATSLKSWARNCMFNAFSYPTRFIADTLYGCSTEAGMSRFGKKCKSEKYHNFNNGIELDKFEVDPQIRKLIRGEFGISENTLVIGTVGRLTEQKNPSFIYKVFKEAIKKNSNVICLWVGTGEQENHFKQLILKDHLDERIIMTGVRSDVAYLMQAFDCFLFPSLWEGLPVTAIEAQAAGLKCLLSDSISKESEITDNVFWKSLQDSASDWADQCLQLAQECREHRESPVDQIRESGYDVEESARQLAEFYLEKAV